MQLRWTQLYVTLDRMLSKRIQRCVSLCKLLGAKSITVRILNAIDEEDCATGIGGETVSKRTWKPDDPIKVTGSGERTNATNSGLQSLKYSAIHREFPITLIACTFLLYGGGDSHADTIQ